MRHTHAPESSEFRDGPVRSRRRQHDPEGRFGGHSRGAHDGHWTGGRGRGRAQRGDVRAAVLMLLSEQPVHGYQLMRAIIERTAGAWRPTPGAVHPTIAQLEDEGVVSVVAEAGRNTAAREIVDRARRQLYLILADGVSTSPTALTEAAGPTGDPS